MRSFSSLKICLSSFSRLKSDLLTNSSSNVFGIDYIRFMMITLNNAIRIHTIIRITFVICFFQSSHFHDCTIYKNQLYSIIVTARAMVNININLVILMIRDQLLPIQSIDISVDHPIILFQTVLTFSPKLIIVSVCWAGSINCSSRSSAE